MIRKGSIYGIGTPRELFTPRAIREVYGVEATFLYDTTGNPVVVPVRAAEERT